MWVVRHYGRMRFPVPLGDARFEKSFILISIADEGENWESHTIPDSPNLVEALKLNFHEHSPVGRSTWSNERTLRAHRCFSARDANKILDLLTRRLREADEVVIVCEAGLYRSVAFANAIGRLLGTTPTKADSKSDEDLDWLEHRLLWHAKRKHWQPPTCT